MDKQRPALLGQIRLGSYLMKKATDNKL